MMGCVVVESGPQIRAQVPPLRASATGLHSSRFAAVVVPGLWRSRSGRDDRCRVAIPFQRSGIRLL